MVNLKNACIPHKPDYFCELMLRTALKVMCVPLLGVMLNFSAVRAQDPGFTQFYASPLYTNPAFAGAGAGCGGRIVLNYRNQWPSLARTYVTTAASFDRHYDNLAGGIGILVTNDVAGPGLLTTRTISGIYAYELAVTRDLTVRFGVQASFHQKSIDWDKLTWADQIEPRSGFVLQGNEPRPNTNIQFPNFSTGAVAYTEKYYGGIAIHNLIEPNQSFYRSTAPGSTLPRRMTLHGGMNIPIGGRSSNFTLSPNVLFMIQKQFTQVNFGLYLNKSSFIAGLWYRQTRPNSDALMVLVGFKSGMFKFGYSYDLTVSDARVAATGSHELSTAIEFKCANRSGRPQMLKCPDF